MDPESGLDAVRHVGLRAGEIAAISARPLESTEVIDVSGLVVAPGFIDLHAHGQNMESNRYQAMDGVTTALELEAGVWPVDEYYVSREGHALIHFGATVSHGGIRREVLARDDSRYDAATDAEMSQMEDMLREGLAAGALGVGHTIQYNPGATREEVYRMFRTATEEGVTNFVHVRYAGKTEPGSGLEAVHEMIANATSLGASVHVVHIGSSGLGQVPIILDMIEGAQRSGVDITTEVYPYTGASTGIKAAIFDPGWRERFEVDYDAIEWVTTGERLTQESFDRYREEGGMIIAHVIPEAVVDYAVAHPIVMIASDGLPFVEGRAHPRGQGTFARILGRHVREKKALTLMEALRKMSLMPARRLEAVVPAFARKGRIRVGTDADIVVFDPGTVLDIATFQEAAQFSAGIHHVMVGGTFVVRAGELVEGVAPGKGIRRRVD
jgi:dihydroorotase